jgi:hypothetical protein
MVKLSSLLHWEIGVMTRLSADAVVSTLPLLDKASLRNVQQALSMLLGEQHTVERFVHPEGFEAILFDAVVAEFRARGLKQTMPFDAFRKTSRYKSWKRNLDAVASFINTQFKNHTNDDRAKLGLCRLLVSALITELRERGIGLSFGAIAANIGRLPEVFDNAFPGYLESGLAYIVPLAMKRNGMTAS